MKYKHIWLLALSVLAFSCSDDDGHMAAPDNNDDNPAEITGRDVTLRPGDIDDIHLFNVPARFEVADNISAGEVRITSDEDMDDKISYYIENGQLHLEGDGSGGVIIYTHPDNLRKLVVRGNEEVYFEQSPELDYLEIETQGNSVLRIDDMKIRNLVTRREGGSRMYFSSLLSAFNEDTLYLDQPDVVLLEDHYLVYAEAGNEYLLFAPFIEVRNDSVIAYRDDTDNLVSYFLTQTHETRSLGNSELHTFELPTLRVNARVNGNTETNIWAADYLEVEGVGNSTVNYIGDPATELDLNGQAEVIKVD
ncbi:GIN domain-containing protein [Roseivirga sp. BDSF3-8]|uniref:GIN domain-containing protein n=1 Tax=Roseivirga sp. BDSF3-8 TaxID=3241598 RepID=UPI00353211DF